MAANLIEYYQQQKVTLLETCTACGKCIRSCPIIEHSDLAACSSRDIQKALLEYLAGGEMNAIVRSRIDTCMACFRCSVDTCPQGLDPMQTIELAKWEDRLRRSQDLISVEQQPDLQPQKVMASIQVSPAEFKHLFQQPTKSRARTVFFPGCNVYNQPEKVLMALDIMDIIAEDWVYLPGVDNCCGDRTLFEGDIENAQLLSDGLVERLCAFEPQTVVFWCPTCKCRFDRLYETLHDLPFRMLSFPQYLIEHLGQLPMQGALFPMPVTLHEACKAAYTGSDADSTRELLHRLPAYELLEMPRHGINTACCGSGAVSHAKDSFNIVRSQRLQEAEATGACKLVDVCHYCHQVFSGASPKIDVVNYITLLAEGMGIARPDKLKLYLKWGDVDRIMEDAAPFIEQSPYSEEKIRTTIESFIKEDI